MSCPMFYPRLFPFYVSTFFGVARPTRKVVRSCIRGKIQSWPWTYSLQFSSPWGLLRIKNLAVPKCGITRKHRSTRLLSALSCIEYVPRRITFQPSWKCIEFDMSEFISRTSWGEWKEKNLARPIQPGKWLMSHLIIMRHCGKPNHSIQPLDYRIDYHKYQPRVMALCWSHLCTQMLEGWTGVQVEFHVHFWNTFESAWVRIFSLGTLVLQLDFCNNLLVHVFLAIPETCCVFMQHEFYNMLSMF